MPPHRSCATTPDLTRLGARFGDLAELVGAQVPVERVHPGEEIVVGLCWRALAATNRNLSEFVHVVRADTTKIAARETYPGLGRYPTSDWRPGDLFCDHIPVRLERAQTSLPGGCAAGRGLDDVRPFD